MLECYDQSFPETSISSEALMLRLQPFFVVLVAVLFVVSACTDDAGKGTTDLTNSDSGDAGANAESNSGTNSSTPNAGANASTPNGSTPNASTPNGNSNANPGSCTTTADCASSPETPYCNPAGRCVECIEGDANAVCATGTCCGFECTNTNTDVDNCGMCRNSCTVAEGTPGCAGGTCRIAQCPAGTQDCDGDLTNGCEAAEGACVCVPGNVQNCYSGPAGTEGVGACVGGTQVCNDSGTGFGPCDGEVVPEMNDPCDDMIDNDCNGTVNDGFADGAAGCVCMPGFQEPCYDGPAGTEGVGTCVGGMRECEITGTNFRFCQGQVTPEFDTCGNNVDEDCDGTADNPPDADGDGWTACQGDCCDSTTMGCGDPALVNPGAIEFVGNMVDDDCDGTVDVAPASCDAGLASDTSVAMNYASAMDLCQTTVETPPQGQRTWGVISAGFSLTNGSGTPSSEARSIRSQFGTTIVPQAGSSLAVLSTGSAAYPGATSPSYTAWQGGLVHATSSPLPADWLAANQNSLPNAPGCPPPQGGTTANDPIMLKLRIRVPTNANSFTFNSYFLSSEYPEWVCSAFNDFFLVLLDSTFAGTPANPSDKNLATYTAPSGAVYPVGVNLAYGDTGLFTQCLNGPTGCGGGVTIAGSTSTCLGTADLTGTGFDAVNPPAQFANDPGWCGSSNLAGGGTGWLTTSGNVVPGETIELRILVWDTGDGYYDSAALLDNFRWNVNASTPGTDN